MTDLHYTMRTKVCDEHAETAPEADDIGFCFFCRIAELEAAIREHKRSYGRYTAPSRAETYLWEALKEALK